MIRKPKPPGELTPEAKRLWQKIFAEADMDEPGLVLLNELCAQWDRLQQARALIKRDGLVLIEKTAAGDSKHRAHPACQIENNAAAAMMRAWRLLGFDQAVPGAE